MKEWRRGGKGREGKGRRRKEGGRRNTHVYDLGALLFLVR
jgi:hypothetical protein